MFQIVRPCDDETDDNRIETDCGCPKAKGKCEV